VNIWDAQGPAGVNPGKRTLKPPPALNDCFNALTLANSYGTTNMPTGAPYPEKYGPSDLVAVTESRAIVIGSTDMEVPIGLQETWVFIVDLSPPAGDLPCLAEMRFDTTSGMAANEIHGHAHDVAISPDGVWAVVSELNWAHCFYVPTGVLMSSIQLGASVGAQFIPSFSVDSVEVTNDRAVVISTVPNGLRYECYATIIDLTANPPAILAQHHVSDGNTQAGEWWFIAHDLAITPNKALAWVVASQDTSCFDLLSGTEIPHNITPFSEDFIERFYPEMWQYSASDFHSGQVDSVECIDGHAFTLGVETGTTTRNWHVRYWQVQSNPTPQIAASPFIRPMYAGTWNAFGPEPQDLAISTGTDPETDFRVLVSMDNELFSVAPLLPPPLGYHPSNWLNNTGIVVRSYWSAPSSKWTRVSDSVVFQSLPVVYPYAAANGIVIGADSYSASSQGVLGVIPLSLPLSSTNLVKYSQNNQEGGYNKPSDIEIVSRNYDVVLRCTSPPDEPETPPMPSGKFDHPKFRPDVAGSGLPPGTYFPIPGESWGGLGRTWTAVDSISAVRNVAAALGDAQGTAPAESIMWLHLFYTW
jgi:hypothetical protein